MLVVWQGAPTEEHADSQSARETTIRARMHHRRADADTPPRCDMRPPLGARRMKINGSRVLMTGAESDIGYGVAVELGRRGAALALAGRDMPALRRVAADIRALGAAAACLHFDPGQWTGHADLVDLSVAALGGLDALVSIGGISRFTPLAEHSPTAIRELIDVNVTGALLLAHAVLPQFLRQNAGRVVIVGSIHGAVGFPHFAAYAASKFALRGFAESLRRELLGTGVKISYITTRRGTAGTTGASARAVLAWARTPRRGAPEAVAARIVAAIARDRRDAYIGWPERLLARVNSVFPRLVDAALWRHSRAARRLARHPVR